ncbi:MAG: septum site-determining protein Ssd [Nocardioidaceae bacterium]
MDGKDRDPARQTLDPEPVPVIVSADHALLDELQSLCAAAGVASRLALPHELHALWRAAPIVMVGADEVRSVARLELCRRDDLIVVTTGPDQPEIWRDAVALRADHVVALPDAQQWLTGRLTDIADGSTGVGSVVAVIGGCGGAGATTFSCALALHAARGGVRTLLVDADPLGGGIDLVVGCETQDGLRWPDLATTQGRVNAREFRSALPSIDDLSVLSWDRGDHVEVDQATMRAMLTVGRRSADLVVVDLPRHAITREGVGGLLTCERALLVTTCDLRSVAASRRVLQFVGGLGAPVRLVARTSSTSDLPPDLVAASLELSLLASYPTYRGLPRAVSEGLGPLARGRWRRPCSEVLRDLALPGDRR